jgi:hypothetical protein
MESKMHRKTVVVLGVLSFVVAGVVLFLIITARPSDSDEPRRVAIALAQDVLQGNGDAACSLLAPSSRAALQNELAVLYSSHYSQDTAKGTCPGFFDNVAVDYYGAGHVPQLPAATNVAVSQERATVTFPGTFDLALYGHRIVLIRTGGTWRVQLDSSPSRSASIHESDAPDAAISAWNDAVRAGAVQPPPLTGLASQQIWAFISPSGPYSMTIDTPSLSATYIQQPDGSWVTEPSLNPPSEGILSRNVWLDPHALATPASTRAPDGSLPALARAETSATAASPENSASTSTSGASSTPAAMPTCGTVSGPSQEGARHLQVRVTQGPLDCDSAVEVARDYVSTVNRARSSGPAQNATVSVGSMSLTCYEVRYPGSGKFACVESSAPYASLAIEPR